MTRTANDLIGAWPGKSAAGPSGFEHPAVYHMLDVGAVAERLLGRENVAPPFADAMVMLVALHDLGKISMSFRDMLQRGHPQAAGSHWEVTEAYLRLFDDEVLAPQLGATWQSRHQLYAAAAGHHGRPPTGELMRGPGGSPVKAWEHMLRAAGQEAIADAKSVTRAFLKLWPNASLGSLTLAEAKAWSWRLAGLATAADWIASNVAWFPPTAPGPSIEDHLTVARDRAVSAVAAAGLDTPTPSGRAPFSFTLRPMQSACVDAALPEGPMLAILEDETGSGKTEAALLLAQRMLCAGKGRGLYFALPTMATSDAMFSRVESVLPGLYDGPASLVLAHGRAKLTSAYRSLVDAHAHNPDEPGPTEWLADNRRRALLADVGVGTIDQAMLAVLRAKHAPLRQFGLASKILIVDEVHEMGDPYMGEIVATLLHVHAANGGSAILLSATIPLALRQKLVDAFDTGAGRAAEALDYPTYPALTVSGAGVRAVAVAPSPRGPVEVRRLAGAEAALDVLTEAAASGAACVWVRNAVDEAISAVNALRARGVEADLLHARFALVDRQRHEAAALQTFGKARAARPGRVLVATQIVESSLDLDFDVMVSDLAPMAALIQRAGRLWRHMDLRPAPERPVPGPVVHVVAPDPAVVEDTNWLRDAIGRGAFTYPLDLQWRTARVLFDTGRIEAPGGLRALIEPAHGTDIAVPDVLMRAEVVRLGKDGAQRSLASQNLIEWGKGYRAGGAGAADTSYPTRLGVDQKVLILARREGGRLVPWWSDPESGGVWTVEACQRSEVQAALHRFKDLKMPDQAAPELAAIFKGLPEWIRSDRTICPVDHDGQICDGLRYSREYGLRFSSPLARG